MHGDACNLSSLRVRGILVISQGMFSYKRNVMETLKDDDSLRLERVHEKSHFVLSSPRRCSRVLETQVFGFFFRSGLG